ncbi:hypothetical protein AYK26_05610 [Euryarchaeota archaeon SM23-78]|nr:MAG: hypothetical protein AYK26_05610 [Euryarchaeota archaeon SM23-78]
MKLIIFTDLDGTLLDHNTYAFEAAKLGLELVKEKNIPLVLCTSKTFDETVYYQKLLGINEPFIVEDGGAIYIPQNYFNFGFECQEKKGHLVIELGTDYGNLRRALLEIKEQGFEITGFGDLGFEQISQDTGLSLEMAKLAAEREYDEPFKLIKGDESVLKKLIEERSLKLSKGGRYYHITGKNDKGKTVALLTSLFKKQYGEEEVVTLGIGDSENDFAMLDAVDKGYLVKKTDNSYASEDYEKAEGIGPDGWRFVIEKEIS